MYKATIFLLLAIVFFASVASSLDTNARYLLRSDRRPASTRQTRATCASNEMATDQLKGQFVYQGGPLMTNPTAIYFIYYGNKFSNLPQMAADVTYYVNNLGSSPWYAYTAALKDKSGNSISTQLSHGGDLFQTTLTYGTSISGDNIQSLVTDAINAGTFPASSDAQYYVVAGDDIAVQGSCSTNGDFCGYHSWYFDDARQIYIKFGYISADVTTIGCVNGCNEAAKGPHNPNTNVLITVLAHEIIETMSDPQAGNDVKGQGNGWRDDGTQAQGENGDLCAFLFFNFQTNARGNTYNIQVGNQFYLTQSNFNSADNCCAYPDLAAQTPGISTSPAIAPSTSNSISTGATPSTSAIPPSQLPSGQVSQGLLSPGINCRPLCFRAYRKCTITTSTDCVATKNACLQGCSPVPNPPPVNDLGVGKKVKHF